MSARRQTKGRVRASERKDIKKARVRVCARVETRTGYKYSYGKYTVNPSKLKIISSSFVVVVVVVVTILEDDFTRDKEKVTTTNKQLFLIRVGLTKPNAFERKGKEETKKDETKRKRKRKTILVVVVVVIIHLEQKTICAQQTWPQQQRKDLRKFNRSSSIAPDRYVSIASRVSLWRRNPMMIFYFVAKEALIIAQTW